VNQLRAVDGHPNRSAAVAQKFERLSVNDRAIGTNVNRESNAGFVQDCEGSAEVRRSRKKRFMPVKNYTALARIAFCPKQRCESGNIAQREQPALFKVCGTVYISVAILASEVTETAESQVDSDRIASEAHASKSLSIADLLGATLGGAVATPRMLRAFGIPQLLLNLVDQRVVRTPGTV
jgi:hypothetical protein